MNLATMTGGPHAYTGNTTPTHSSGGLRAVMAFVMGTSSASSNSAWSRRAAQNVLPVPENQYSVVFIGASLSSLSPVGWKVARQR